MCAYPGDYDPVRVLTNHTSIFPSSYNAEVGGSWNHGPITKSGGAKSRENINSQHLSSFARPVPARCTELTIRELSTNLVVVMADWHHVQVPSSTKDQWNSSPLLCPSIEIWRQLVAWSGWEITHGNEANLQVTQVEPLGHTGRWRDHWLRAHISHQNSIHPNERFVISLL